MDINYNHLRVFEAVARYENLTMAASELMISQPSVSSTIQKLENALDCRLFIRKPKGMSLTKEGETLYANVHDGLNIISRGLTSFKTNTTVQHKVLQIAGSQSFINGSLLPRVLKDFNANYPEVITRVHGCHSSQAMHRLDIGLSDLAFTYSIAGFSNSMQVVSLAKTKPIFIAGDKFKGLAGRCLSVSELLEYPLISYSASNHGRYFWSEIFMPLGFQPPSYLDVNSTELMLLAVKENIGIGLILKQSAEVSLERGQVFQLDVDVNVPTRTLSLVLPKGERERHIQAFYDTVCKYISAQNHLF